MNNLGWSNTDVQLGQRGALYTEFKIKVRLQGYVAEIDLLDVAVFFLGEIERKLKIEL
jgi:hypothetical protein